MLYLVRHGKAAGGHLSEVGRQQADQLVTTLGDAPITRIASSPKKRCRDTIAPLAAATGLLVETYDDLDEHADIDPAWELLTSLGEDVVVCSHAPVIEAVLNRLHRRGGEVVSDEWSVPPGSIWRVEASLSRADRVLP